MSCLRLSYTLLVLLLLGAPACKPAPIKHAAPASASARPPGVVRVQFHARGLRLVVELLDDDLAHFELSAAPASASAAPPAAVPVSPMVHKVNYPGPRWVRRPRPSTLVTPQLRLEVDPQTLAVTVRTVPAGVTLTTTRPLRSGGRLAGLSLTRQGTRNVYGLGQQFPAPGQADGDWLGRVRQPGNAHGNKMVSYEGGAVGNTQFPIAYALGSGRSGYGLFVDRPEAQRWDLRQDPWRVTMAAPNIRWYLLAGEDLPDLRRDYMELTGRPPVPPRKALGLWLSEYGYRSWDHVHQKLATLRQRGFPLDGVVLDLFWFGGITGGSPHSRMGALTWDTKRFADPARQIAALRRQGVGVVLIEESYVSKGLPEFNVLRDAGYLVRRPGGRVPLFLDQWWGAGGMLDWTSRAASDFWHDYRRQALVRQGVMGHWTDLGEPENFDASGRYHGLPPAFDGAHAAVANLYNLAWAASIQRGYRRHRVRQRPWILTRSGASGIQRTGAALWSGDIGSNLRSLRSHFNAQLHLSLSGVDYYGSDLGGFHRSALKGDLGQVYTQWFACGMAVDVPARPHTQNLKQQHETAPDRVGHRASNLANTRLRYRLAPYIYSLAHQAHRTGEAVFPPLVYHFQQDLIARKLGSQKMIGHQLMVALVARLGVTSADVYLPAGRWVDYHSGAQLVSEGKWLRQVPLRHQGWFRLPLYARAGALIPEAAQGPKSRDMLGRAADGSVRADPLAVRVFPAAAATSFTLHEDDGQTVAYLSGEVRTTRLSQQRQGAQATVTVAPARGSYQGAVDRRVNVVTLVAPGDVQRVSLNGKQLPRLAGPKGDEAGWFVRGKTVLARSAPLPVAQAKVFVFATSN